MVNFDLQLLLLMKGLRSPKTCIDFSLLSSNSPVVKILFYFSKSGIYNVRSFLCDVKCPKYP